MADTMVAIPGYTIERKLGHGGMAIVYLAMQHSFERHVALKVMSPMLNSDPTFAARFKREARIVAQLNHSSIVPVFEVGEYQNHHFLSMEYLPGGDLKRRILTGRCGLGMAIEVCAAVSAALDVAHRKGFVHRDIKPENVLFREDGTPVLTDFGIARAVESSRSLTMAGMLVGTPDYMSPEQVKGLELDGRSDLYSVGTVFYEILTGAVPFNAESTLSIALKQVSDPLPPLPAEYAAYQDFLNQLTAKDREDRFATGADVIRALGMIGGGRSYSIADAREYAAPPVEIAHADDKPDGVPVRRSSEPTLARVLMPSERVVEAPAAAIKPGRAGNATAQKSRSHKFPSLPPLNHSMLRSRPAWLAAAAGGILLVVTAVLAVKQSHRTAGSDASSTAPVLAVAQQVEPQTSPTGNHPYEPPTPTPPVPPTSTNPPTIAKAVEVASTAAAAVIPRASATASDNAAATAQPKSDVPEPRKKVLDARRQRQEEQARAIAERVAALRAEQLQAQDVKIQSLLQEAKNEFAAGAIWQPAGANAAERYREILSMQADRPEGLAGARRVAGILAAESEHAEAAGDVYNSQLLINLIRSLDPGNGKLAGLQDRLQQMEDKPTDMSGRERGHLEKAAKSVAAAYENLDRRPLDYKAVDGATDQFDKATSAEPMAPGLPTLRERLVTAYVTAIQTELDNHDTKRALKLIGNAHKRGWLSPELAVVEARLNTDTSAAAGAKEASTH